MKNVEIIPRLLFTTITLLNGVESTFYYNYFLSKKGRGELPS